MRGGGRELTWKYPLTLLETIGVAVPSTWNARTVLYIGKSNIFSQGMFSNPYSQGFRTQPKHQTVRTASLLWTFSAECKLERR